MKVRSGFVSNSSSSSFIVASDSDDLTATVKINLKSLIRRVFSTKEDVLKFYFHDYGYESMEEFQEDTSTYKTYEAIIKAIESGKKVYQGLASSESDNGTEQFVLWGGLSSVIGGLEVIKSSDGY